MNDNELADAIGSMLETFADVRDVCLALGLGEDELDAMCRKWFGAPLDDSVERFRAKGRAKIHAAQVKAAMDGDRSMLLLLGKQYLGQTDEPQLPHAERKDTALDRAKKRRGQAKDRKSKTAR